jgi:hypothetical protein
VFSRSLLRFWSFSTINHFCNSRVFHFAILTSACCADYPAR